VAIDVLGTVHLFVPVLEENARCILKRMASRRLAGNLQVTRALSYACSQEGSPVHACRALKYLTVLPVVLSEDSEETTTCSTINKTTHSCPPGAIMI